MLDTTLQLDEGRLRENSGRTPETADVSAIYDRSVLLMQAAAVGADAASGARESGWKGDWLVLLQALCKLTVTQASAGDPAPLFTAERLRQEIASLVGDPEAQWWSDESDTARKKFTNAWRALENDIGRIEENLCGRAISSRVAGIVTLSTPTRLGTTNAMGYGLSVSPIALPATAAAEPPPITNAPVGGPASSKLPDRLLGGNGGLPNPWPEEAVEDLALWLARCTDHPTRGDRTRHRRATELVPACTSRIRRIPASTAAGSGADRRHRRTGCLVVSSLLHPDP